MRSIKSNPQAGLGPARVISFRNVSEEMPVSAREITRIVSAQSTSDGDGVQLKRVIGTQQLNYLDPFLLLDEFGSDKPLDYIGGFPAHPHRGFETVTYMLAGKMKHQDSTGHSGVIESGDIQWMTAGKGIVHSEMPEQTHGVLAGLQLWVNLPSKRKMSNPRYQEFPSSEIPQEIRKQDITIKIIAGITSTGHKGVIENTDINPNYWHAKLPESSGFSEPCNPDHNAFIYVLKGKLFIGDKQQMLQKEELAVLSSGDKLKFYSQTGCEFIYVDGKPLNEPVFRGGPFVMNTRQEILQAFEDFKNGSFV